MSVNPSQQCSAAGAAEPDFFPVRVVRKEALAGGIHMFELRDPGGKPLPPFTAGAHLTVQVPAGMRRNYSLSSNPADTAHYQIAVKRDSAGRGGSVSMVDDVQEGDLLSISAPRNNFELHPRAEKFLFIAGGIGITPVLSMMRHLKTQGNNDFRLIYCTRDPESTAFLADLTGPEFGQHVQVHHDHGDLDNALDFWPVFETPTKAHVYCCGPRGLMESVADMSGHWPSGAVHFESFGVDASAYAANTPFTVRLQKSGKTLAVGADDTILDVLRGAGLRVPSSCESGTCGSCKTRLLAGQAEHRDMVLSEEEREQNIMVCVSRAVSPELVLDL
ncbi:MAG: phthalate 4,5-dioxygenase, reductase subunit [Polaromonas sp.]|nr:phthalate 4,5-dioxygenase, reductase subunit [Polaromonas sp.]